MNKFTALLAIAGFATAASAQAAVPTWLYGSTVPDSSATQVVVISPSTKDVSLRWGRSVEFMDHGKSFAYEFNGPMTNPGVNLQRLAPAGMIGHPVYAYVVRGFSQNR